MTLDLSAFATEFLLDMINDGEDHGEDFSYQALWGTLFPRWRAGVDLKPLIELLQSEKSRDRVRAAYYLDEAVPPASRMVDTVIGLADDPIGECRWRFVAYVTNSGLYSDVVAGRLAASLLDMDLYVRAHTIFWAIVASDQIHGDFAERIRAGSGRRSGRFSNADTSAFWRNSEDKRALRGIAIAHQLRNEEVMADVRARFPEEDSFVFDHLEFMTRQIRRSIAKRHAGKG
jgi:hypothetical protein